MHALDPANADTKELRNFGLVTGAMVVVFFGLLLPWIWNGSWPVWPWVVAIVLGAWGLLLPSTLGPVYRAWMKFALVLGWINTRIILGFIFFVIFLPVGLVIRIVSRDPMMRKFVPDATSYRVESKQPAPENLEKPF